MEHQPENADENQKRVRILLYILLFIAVVVSYFFVTRKNEPYQDSRKTNDTLIMVSP